MTASRVRAERACAVLLSLLIALPLLMNPLLPTQDGFQHLMHGFLWNHLNDGGAGYASFFERGTPITGWGFTWVFAPLERVLGWATAYQTTLALIALSMAWSARALINVIAGRTSPWGLLGFSLAFPWAFYMGFLPYLTATALGFAAIAWGTRRAGTSWVEGGVLAACLMLCAMMHVFAAATAGVALLVLRTVKADQTTRLGVAVHTTIAGIPAALIAGLASGVAHDNVASQGGSAENHLLWHDWGQRVLELGSTGIGGPAWRWLPVLIAALFGCGAAWRRSERTPRAAAALAVAFFLFALLAPFHMTAWEYFSPRTLPLALVLGLGALAGSTAPRRQPALLAASFAVCLATLGWAQLHNAALSKEADQALAGLGDVARDGWRLPLIFDTGSAATNAVAYAKPLANLGAVYSVAQGGVVPYVFASSPSIHQHLFQSNIPLVPVPDRSYFGAPASLAGQPERLTALRTSLLRDGAQYQDVIIYGDQTTIELAKARGFAMDFESPSLLLAHFVGCPLELEFDPTGVGVLDGDSVSLEWGWFPLLDGSRTAIEVPRTGGRGILVPLDTACGDVWISVNARSGGQLVACRGAGPDGQFVLRLEEPPEQPIPCHLELR